MMNRGGFLHQHEIVHGDGTAWSSAIRADVSCFLLYLGATVLSSPHKVGRKARMRAERSSGWVRLHRGRWRRSHWIDIFGERLHVLSC
jgi:hypothetical protein